MTTTFLVPKNNANSKLSAAISSSATSLTVLNGEGARFPSSYPFHITIDNEILKVTNRSTDTFTVQRAQESTAAAAHKAGANVRINITAKAISDLNSAVNALETAPPAHGASHENGGSDEINVTGLSGELADPQTPVDHNTSHESGGSDEISLAGLTGEATTPQPPKSHAGSHGSGGSDPLKLDDLAAPDDNTDLNASITKHGLLPKLDNDPAHYLDGQGNFTVPPATVPDKSARVTHSAAQSIVSASATYLSFNTEVFDTDDIHDNSTNNSRLTCKTAGKYLIIASIKWATANYGHRQLSIELNRTTTIGLDMTDYITSTSVTNLVATIYDLAVDDYVECVAYQNSGAAQNVLAASPYTPSFMMIKIA